MACRTRREYLRRAAAFAILLVVFIPWLTADAERKGQAPDAFEELLHRGFASHQKNEYAAAIPPLEDAWKLRPHDYFANLLLGIDLLRTGRVTEAVPHLREAVRQKPREEFAYDYLGEAYAALGESAEAFYSFRTALVVTPGSADAKAAFARYCLERFARLSTEMRSSKFGLAAEYRLQAANRSVSDPLRVELLERATELFEDADNWAQLAVARISVGDLPAGRDALERARKLAPSKLAVREAEALGAARATDWDTARSALEEFASRSPAVLAKMRLDWPATLQPGNEKLAGAAAEFLDCTAKSCSAVSLLSRLPKPAATPGAPAARLYREERWERLASLRLSKSAPQETRFQRGVALAEISNCDEAVPALEQSLGSKESVALAMFYLSQCYVDEANRMARELAEARVNEPLVHILRGDVLLRLKADGTGAIEEYRAAIAGQPGDPAAWERLAEAQLFAGLSEDAQRSAQKALGLDEHRLDAMRTLAQAAVEERNYAEALPFLRRLLKENPKDLQTRVQLAIASSQVGELDDALKNLEFALGAGYPDEKGSLHYELGTILRGLGRSRDSQEAFGEAKKLSERFQNTSLRNEEMQK